jgi:LysM repeat protein
MIALPVIGVAVLVFFFACAVIFFALNSSSRFSLAPYDAPTQTLGGEITKVAFGTTPVVAQTTSSPIPLASPSATITLPDGYTMYTVQWGDWMRRIAEKHGVSIEALVAANPTINPDRLYPGLVLIIPPPDGSTSASPTGGATPIPPSGNPTTYIVQQGDFFYAIARKFNISVVQLQAANPGVNPNVLYTGQVLNIPGAVAPGTFASGTTTSVPFGAATPIPANATTPPYRYKSANKRCEHSGNYFIDGSVYYQSVQITGVNVVISSAPDGTVTGRAVSGARVGYPTNFNLQDEEYRISPGQKRFVWVVENGQRSSDIVEFSFNALPETDSNSCWRGLVDFIRLY